MNKGLENWEKPGMEMRPKIRYWLPAAAMEEEDLKQEIRELFERGFGGVEVVVLFNVPSEIAKGEDGWGTENWNYMVGVIADETKRLGMTMDIANGPGWPISSPALQTADDAGVLCELTYGVCEIPSGRRFAGVLPKGRKRAEEGTVHLVQALAYRAVEENVLAKDSCTDLTPYVKEESGNWRLEWLSPEEGKTWKIFAFYAQPAIQRTNYGQCYVIDHLSREGAAACEKYWDGVLAKYNYESMESFFCDSLEYRVSLDWTPEFSLEFEKRRGYSILPYLPFIGKKAWFLPCDIPGYVIDEEGLGESVNRDYMEVLTQCYCENHLAGLEKMAEKYGRTVRYQVAYNKFFEAERSAYYVSVPENEALGRPAIDYQKTMAAAVHLGRKERYSFECAAEFGHSYGQNYEDLFWWVKRSLMAGMNAQVLHGASYSGRYTGKYAVNNQIPGVKWPGYEGFGKKVSNYWNRTLSKEHARGCLDAIARLNTVFSKKAKVDCLIYRFSYENDGCGGEYCLYDDGGLLGSCGYSYEFASEFLLNLPVCRVTEGELDREGAGYRCLIIPEYERLPQSFLERAAVLAQEGFPVIWIGEKPKGGAFYLENSTVEAKALWGRAMDGAWTGINRYHAENMEQVPGLLGQKGILPRVRLDASVRMITAAREEKDGEGMYCALYGMNCVVYSPDEPNPDEISCSAMYKKGTTKGSYERPGSISRKKLEVKLEGKGRVYVLNYWSGERTPGAFSFDQNLGCMRGTVEIEEDEMLLLYLDGRGLLHSQGEPAWNVGEREEVSSCDIRWKSLMLQTFGPDTAGEVSFLRSGFSKEAVFIDLSERKLVPWRELRPELEHFAGKGIYEGVLGLTDIQESMRYFLNLGDVSDTFRVWINGVETKFPNQVLKCVEVTGLLREGDNALKVEVVSNLYNRLFAEDVEDEIPGGKYLPRKYGMWESEGKKIGLFCSKSIVGNY